MIPSNVNVFFVVSFGSGDSDIHCQCFKAEMENMCPFLKNKLEIRVKNFNVRSKSNETNDIIDNLIEETESCVFIKLENLKISKFKEIICSMIEFKNKCDIKNSISIDIDGIKHQLNLRKLKNKEFRILPVDTAFHLGIVDEITKNRIIEINEFIFE